MRALAKKCEHEQYFYLRTLQRHFRPGVRWLDAGCGHTLIPKWLNDSERIERKFLEEAGMIVGADIDAPSLSAPSSIRRIACDLSALAFENGSFDLVTSNMVVEHIAEPGKVFGEFFRVLRPGGIVVILTPNVHHFSNLVSRLTPFWFHKWALARLGERPPEDIFPTLYRCNTRSAMQKHLRAAGFSIEAVHMVPGRQRLINFTLLFYLEYLFYRLSLRFSELREILCAVAQKPPAVAAGIPRAAS